MALPNPTAFDAAPLTISNGDVSVTFNFRSLSGRRYYQIVREFMPDSKVSKEPDADGMSITIMSEAIATVYSNVESTPIEFTEDMAREIWENWDQWARTKITNTIVQRCTQGVDADPKAG